jgi:SOS-response transcriptional repressor LexA
MNGADLQLTEVRRVMLRLRAGMAGFDAEPDMTTLDPLAIPTSVVRAAKVNPATLLAMRVRDRGMEPMFFEDDWIVIDTADTAMRNREVFAVNWNGDACVYQLLNRGGQWYLAPINPEFGPVNMKSGQCSVVGRVVYQPGRVVTGRL